MNKISIKQLVANQKNAMKGGVKTSKGKAISSKNAIKHGIFSKDFVIDKGLIKESKEEYERLVQDLHDDWRPSGRLEIELVEIIANGLWRKKRVQRAEKGEIRKLNDNLEIDYERGKEESRKMLEPFLNLSMKINEPINYKKFDKPLQLLVEIIDEFEVLEEFPENKKDEIYETFKEDTTFCTQIRFIAYTKGRDEKMQNNLIMNVLLEKKSKVEEERQRAKTYEENIKIARTLSNYVPNEQTAQKISRYGTWIDREMHNAISKLEELQERRKSADIKR